MKTIKVLLVASLLFGGAVLQAQQELPVPTEDTTPSSIDLLRLSLSQSNIASIVSSTTARSTVKSTAVASSSTASASAEAKAVSKPASATEVEKDLDAKNELAPAAPAKTPQAAASKTAVAGAKPAPQAVSSSTTAPSTPTASAKPAAPAASKKTPSTPVAKSGCIIEGDRKEVKWQKTTSNHFIIYTQQRSSGIGSSNMRLIFENAYETLRRNIPWMMSDKVCVFVYQDQESYLEYEPQAKSWMRAMAYPVSGEIVVYDEPRRQKALQEVFTHELVHIFTQKFFDNHTDELATPLWLDEGLAVYIEDQAYNGSQGGPWSNDLRTLNFRRIPRKRLTPFGPKPVFGLAGNAGKSFRRNRRGRVVYLQPFSRFVSEDSLQSMEKKGHMQDWYFQAYAMVRFLLNPTGSTMGPSNQMQFKQLTTLMAQGEQVRDPETGYPVYKQGKPVYQRYSLNEALGRAYHYKDVDSLEDAFWEWAYKLP